MEFKAAYNLAEELTLPHIQISSSGYNTAMSAFKPGSLEDPFYYLHNALQVINWCKTTYADLLSEDELTKLELISSLPLCARALLIRLIMRKGELFRLDQLNYDEIPDLDKAVETLNVFSLIDSDPTLTLDEICTKARKSELLELSSALPNVKILKKQLSKHQLTQLLLDSEDHDIKPLAKWWPNATFSLIKLNCNPLFNRLRLMFFGNLYQDWSEFVVTELGLFKYESVPFSNNSRAFKDRFDVDHYLRIHEFQQQLDEGTELTNLLKQLSSLSDIHLSESPWLVNRYRRLQFQLGQAAEKQNLIADALELYASSGLADATVRQLRVMEKHTSPERVIEQARTALHLHPEPETQIYIHRVLQRCAKKAKIDYRPINRAKLSSEQLFLVKNEALSVEQQVIDHLASNGQTAFHVENSLINGLFALLLWPAIFAPVTGAFFNPYQDGPTDLYRKGFADLRSDEIEKAFNQLKDGSYQSVIRRHWHEKHGTRCSLIHWSLLSEQLIELALQSIPSEHLEKLFNRLLIDLKNHRKGQPDLITFNTSDQSYQLIEVKGPGDRLQEHQKLWLDFFQMEEIPATTYYVVWQDEEMTESDE